MTNYGIRELKNKMLNREIIPTATIDYVVKSLKKIAEYEDIGTIEEFKALKEKNEPKKPIYSDFDDNGNDEIIPYKAVCPVCEYEFEFGYWNDEYNHHCICGQAMDWE